MKITLFCLLVDREKPLDLVSYCQRFTFLLPINFKLKHFSTVFEDWGSLDYYHEPEESVTFQFSLQMFQISITQRAYCSNIKI